MTHWSDPTIAMRTIALDVAEVDFALAKFAKGVPLSAIANMMGRPVEKVRAILPEQGLRRAPNLAFKPWMVRSTDVAASENHYAPSWVRALVIGVAEKHGVTVNDIRSNSRKRKGITEARQEVMGRLYATERCSLTLIGRWLGGRDHTTVRHGVIAHANTLAEKPVDNIAAALHVIREYAENSIGCVGAGTPAAPSQHQTREV